MKRIVLVSIVMSIALWAAPGHAFLEYLFSGSASNDAIGNNVVGDLREGEWRMLDETGRQALFAPAA